MQELLGHSDVGSTMIYTDVIKVAAGGPYSPLDTLLSALHLLHATGVDLAQVASPHLNDGYCAKITV